MNQVSESCPLCRKDVKEGKGDFTTHINAFCNLSENEREGLKKEILELIDKEQGLYSEDLSERLGRSLGLMSDMVHWMSDRGLISFYEE